jgi:uncharacterized membrane protein YqjE
MAIMYVVHDASRFMIRLAAICLILGFLAGVWVMSGTASSATPPKDASSTQEHVDLQQGTRPTSVVANPDGG